MPPRVVPRQQPPKTYALRAEGSSNQEIAERLAISQNTVANHLRNILEKTKARNRAAAASYAVREGLV